MFNVCKLNVFMLLELISPDVKIVLTTCGNADGLFHQAFIAFFGLKLA